jgi:hypothetical protein
MANEYSGNELQVLMDSLSISDEGTVQSANSVMRQKDIDYLVALLRELQTYRDIGTPEECAEYKRKALG